MSEKKTAGDYYIYMITITRSNAKKEKTKTECESVEQCQTTDHLTVRWLPPPLLLLLHLNQIRNIKLQINSFNFGASLIIFAFSSRFAVK